MIWPHRRGDGHIVVDRRAGDGLLAARHRWADDVIEPVTGTPTGIWGAGIAGITDYLDAWLTADGGLNQASWFGWLSWFT